MRKLYNWVLLLSTGLCAILAGCFGGGRTELLYGPQPLYGAAPPPHEPGVVLTDFSYTPATGVQAGDTLTYTVTVNKTFNTSAGQVRVQLGTDTQPVAGVTSRTLFAWPTDDGVAPDVTAGDGIFTASRQIPAFVEPQQDIPVVVEIDWWDEFPGPSLQGDPLDIEEQ